MARRFRRSHRAQRLHRVRINVLVVTVLVGLVVALTSYALAVDPVPSANGGIPVGRATDASPTGRDTLIGGRGSPMAGEPPPMGSASLGVEDGVISDGETVWPFDTSHPAVTNLDPDLRRAIRRAATDAEVDEEM